MESKCYGVSRKAAPLDAPPLAPDQKVHAGAPVEHPTGFQSVSSAPEGIMQLRSRGPIAPLPIIGYRKNGAPIYPIGGGDGTVAGNPVLERLRQERQTQIDFIDATLEKVEERGGDLVEAEEANLRDARDRVKRIDEQIKPLAEFEELRGVGAAAARSFTPSAAVQQAGEGRTMAYANPREHQYRTAGELLADAWKSVNRSDEGSRARLETLGIRNEGGVLTRAALPHTTTAETPGLLPTQIVGEIMKDIDAARPFISTIGAKDLGGIPGTSFKRPYVTGNVKVSKQTAEKSEVEKGQFKVGSVNFTKDTYGGWTNVSRQDIDWTSPGVWDALLTDFQEIYGIETEEAAVTAFAAAVVQETETVAADPDAPTVKEILRGLYDAAALAYAGAKRLPDVIFASLDQWALIGPEVDALKATTSGNGGGDSAIDSFTGNLLRVPRIVVPSLPDGSLIVGVKNRTEVYEDRIGFLSAVQPRVLGVELAYGGYMASGTLNASAFANVTFAEAQAG